MGFIKKLYQNCLVGVPGSEGATEIYPVTSTHAVYDQTGQNNLDDYIPIKTSTPVYIKYSDLAEAQSIIVSAWGSAEESETFLINIWRDEVGILLLNQIGPLSGLLFYKETITKSHTSERDFDVLKISRIEDTLPPYTINIVSFNGKKVPLYSLNEETDTVESSEMLPVGRLADMNWVDSELATKQNTLTFDDTPTAESDNPVKSSGIKTYVDINVTAINNKLSLKEDRPIEVGLDGIHEEDVYIKTELVDDNTGYNDFSYSYLIGAVCPETHCVYKALLTFYWDSDEQKVIATKAEYLPDSSNSGTFSLTFVKAPDHSIYINGHCSDAYYSSWEIKALGYSINEEYDIEVGSDLYPPVASTIITSNPFN